MTVDLRAVYDRFFALGAPPNDRDAGKEWRYRRQVTSMGWPTVELLGELVRGEQPRMVLDLGSGLTSIVLRSLAQEQPEMRVVTTDTSHGWILRTILELRRDGLSDVDCFMHGSFESSKLASEKYDLISVDIADTKFRRELSDKLALWLAPSGVMLLDDWQMEPYASTMTARLEKLGLTVEPQPQTMDEFDRLAALAYRLRRRVDDWQWDGTSPSGTQVSDDE